MKNNYLKLNNNKKNFLFGIEWSMCAYYAFNCFIKNKQHYPEICYEVNEHDGIINYCKIFDMHGKSVEYYSLFGKSIPSNKKLNKIIKYINRVEPS